MTPAKPEEREPNLAAWIANRVEYQHTWWQDANFNTPAASPSFNYTFIREDDVVKFGFTVSLDPTPSAPAHSSMVFKAPPK